MKPAFAYLRVSGPGQTAAEKDGLPRQLRAIEEYASKNDLNIISVFREEGVPGATELEGRPALRQLVAATIPDYAPRCVVIEKLDRLARDLMTQETIIGDFRRRNVEIISCMEPDICSSDPTRVFIRQLFGAVAQYEKNVLVHKLRVARDAKRRAGGRAEGPHPYGTHPKYPEEAQIIEQMKDLRIKHGLTMRGIAETLERQKVPIRNGRGRWNPGSIMRILRRAGVK